MDAQINENLEITFSHADYSNMPSFARVAEESWSGKVAVLPNREVMSACLRAWGARARPCKVKVLLNLDICTVYQVDGKWGEIIVIDSYHGKFEMLDAGADDSETETLVAGRLAELRAMKSFAP